MIMAGTNDIFKASSVRRLDGDAIAANIWRLHLMAHGEGVRTVALGVPRWMSERRSAKPPFTNEMRSNARDAVNEKLRALSRASRGMATYMEFPVESEDFDHDGLHFSKKGYAKAGERLAEKVKPLLQPPVRMLDSGAVKV